MKKRTSTARTRKPISNPAITEAPPWTVGVDIGDKYSQLCVLDASGQIVEKGQILTTPDGFSRRFCGMDKARVVIETGTHSRWVEEEVVNAGHEVIVANARKLEAISKNDRKSDDNDAYLLARLGRADPTLLAPVQHRSAQAQQGLALIRARDALVRSRTALINCVRGMVKSVGARMPTCTSGEFHKHGDALPPGLKDELEPLIEQIGRTTAVILKYEARLEEEMETLAPGARNLTTIPGVGPLTAVAFTLTIDDVKRFDKSRTVGAYLGLVPRRDQSGGADPQLRITKAGNSQLRKMLVQCANVVLNRCTKSESDLREWALNLAGTSKANKRRAVVGVARKLAVLMHRMLVSGKPFDPRHGSRRKAASSPTEPPQGRAEVPQLIAAT